MSDIEDIIEDIIDDGSGGGSFASGGGDSGSGGGSFASGGGDGGDSDHINPCCSMCIGMICLVVSVCGLWWNEGLFVHQMQALGDTRSLIVMPCDYECTKCDFQNALVNSTGEKRPMKSGDIVFASCPIQNMMDVSEAIANGRGFLKELASSVKATGAVDDNRKALWEKGDLAAKFTWKFEMFRYEYDQLAWRSDDLVKYKGGTFKNRRQDYCNDRTVVYSEKGCQESVQKSLWQGANVPTTPLTSPTPPPTPATPAAAQMVEVAQELTLAGSKPNEPAGAAGTSAVDTSDDNSVDASLEAEVDNPMVADTADAQERPGPIIARFLEGAPSVRRRTRRRSRRRAIFVDCVVPRCKVKGLWKSTQPVEQPTNWDRLPVTNGQVDQVDIPAKNVPYSLLSQVNNAFDKIGEAKIGAWLDDNSADENNQLGISNFPQIFKRMAPVNLQTVSPGTKRLEGDIVREKFALPSRTYTEVMPYGNIRVTSPMTYTIQSETRQNVNWDNSSAFLAGGCGAGCICSSPSASQAGDLKVCLQRTTATLISIISGVTGDATTGFNLVPSDVLKKGGGLLADGYFLKIDEKVSANEMISDTANSVSQLLVLFRAILPIIMCVGFYCCLNPILWVIDNVGDTLNEIPCVGGFLDSIAECIETLATVMICCVSCCAALACSLFVGALAWVWYRPQVGVPLLIGSLLVFASLACFAVYQRTNGQKVRKRKNRGQSARQPSYTGSAGSQTQMGQIQQATAVTAIAPAVAVAVPAQPAPQQMQVVCPDGCSGGSSIQITAPDGRMLNVTVPDGVEAGQPFMVMI